MSNELRDIESDESHDDIWSAQARNEKWVANENAIFKGYFEQSNFKLSVRNSP